MNKATIDPAFHLTQVFVGWQGPLVLDSSGASAYGREGAFDSVSEDELDGIEIHAEMDYDLLEVDHWSWQEELEGSS